MANELHSLKLDFTVPDFTSANGVDGDIYLNVLGFKHENTVNNLVCLAVLSLGWLYLAYTALICIHAPRLPTLHAAPGWQNTKEAALCLALRNTKNAKKGQSRISNGSKDELPMVQLNASSLPRSLALKINVRPDDDES